MTLIKSIKMLVCSAKKLMCYPQQLGRSWKAFGHLPRNLLEPHQPSENPLDLISFRPRNPPEPCLLSAPEPSRTRRNLISYLSGNSSEPSSAAPEPHPLSGPEPQPHQPSAPEPSGTSSAICAGTLLRNLVLQLRRIAPELFWAKDPIPSFAVGEKYNLVTKK